MIAPMTFFVRHFFVKFKNVYFVIHMKLNHLNTCVLWVSLYSKLKKWDVFHILIPRKNLETVRSTTYCAKRLCNDTMKTTFLFKFGFRTSFSQFLSLQVNTEKLLIDIFSLFPYLYVYPCCLKAW